MPTYFDASAYRALARDGDTLLGAEQARVRGRALAEHDGPSAVSPFVLWALLADVAHGVRSEREARGRSAPTEAEQARAGRARAAIAICSLHARPPRGETGSHGFVLAPDPDTLACHTLGLDAPRELAAWNEYLASVASELAVEPTAERAQRLAGPLGHIADRARGAVQDFSDEMQDAVLTAYDTASQAWGWDDDTDDATRQAALTGALRDAPEGSTDAGGPLIAALLRRDPLLRAVAAGRVARAHAVISRANRRAADADDEPMDAVDASIDDVARVAERFPTALALGREMLRRVIDGRLEVADHAARRWLWDLQTAFGIGDGRAVTGNATIADAVAAAGGGFEPLPAYRARVGI